MTLYPALQCGFQEKGTFLMTAQLSTALTAFVCAAETGSFAAAGKMLGISAPAVGQSVKRLEEAYGVVLIRRSTRKMNLTPEGALLYERAKEPLKALEDLDRVFNDKRSLVAGPLHITAPVGLGRRIVLPLIGAFKEQYPDVVLELDFTYETRDFIDDGVDAAFRLMSPEDSSLIARRLTSNEYWTLASSSYLQRHGEPQHPNELVNHSILACRKEKGGPAFAWHFDVEGAPRTMPLQPALTLNDPDSLAEAALLGLGVVQLRDDYAAHLVEGGGLQRVLPGFSAPANGLYLCYPYKNNLPARVRTFIDFVIARAKG